MRGIDSFEVYRDADGELEVQHLSSLTKDEAIELGTVIGVAAGAEAMADGVELLDEAERNVLEDIPPDSATALILADLVEVGLLSSDDMNLHALESTPGAEDHVRITRVARRSSRRVARRQ